MMKSYTFELEKMATFQTINETLRKYPLDENWKKTKREVK